MKHVSELLSKMTIREKAGQLIMTRYWNLRDGLFNELRAIIERGENGGFYLCNSSIWDVETTSRLCDILQEHQKGSRSGLPFFIAIEQQGGIANNVTHGAVALAGNQALGRSGRFEDADSLGFHLANQVLACGANMNMAPYLGLRQSTYSHRNEYAISGNPELVAELGAAFVGGANRAGVISCAQGMPNVIPVREGDEDAGMRDPAQYIRSQAFYPFARAIREGLPALMIHSDWLLREASLAEDALACFIYHLRTELGYKGLIVSDNLIGSNDYGKADLERRIVTALNAGVDQLFLKQRHPWIPEFVEDMVDGGYIELDRLDRSVCRVLEHKLRLPAKAASRPVPDREAWREFSLKMAGVSVEKMKQGEAGISLGKSSRLSIVMAAPTRLLDSDTIHRYPISFKSILLHKGYCEHVYEAFLPQEPIDKEWIGIGELCEGADYLVFCSYNGYEFKKQFEFLKYFAIKGYLKIIGVATRCMEDKFELGKYCDDVYVVNGYTPANFEVLADRIFAPSGNTLDGWQGSWNNTTRQLRYTSSLSELKILAARRGHGFP